MQHKKIEKQLVDRTIESWSTCDKCGDKVSYSLGFSESYSHFDFDFQIDYGNFWPEGSDGTKHLLDLCHGCSKDLLKDLNRLGYKTYTEEINI